MVMKELMASFPGYSAFAASPIVIPGIQTTIGNERKAKIAHFTAFPFLATMTRCIAMGWMGHETKTVIILKHSCVISCCGFNIIQGAVSERHP